MIKITQRSISGMFWKLNPLMSQTNYIELHPNRNEIRNFKNNIINLYTDEIKSYSKNHQNNVLSAELMKTISHGEYTC